MCKQKIRLSQRGRKVLRLRQTARRKRPRFGQPLVARSPSQDLTTH